MLPFGMLYASWHSQPSNLARPSGKSVTTSGLPHLGQWTSSILLKSITKASLSGAPLFSSTEAENLKTLAKKRAAPGPRPVAQSWLFSNSGAFSLDSNAAILHQCLQGWRDLFRLEVQDVIGGADVMSAPFFCCCARVKAGRRPIRPCLPPGNRHHGCAARGGESARAGGGRAIW